MGDEVKEKRKCILCRMEKFLDEFLVMAEFKGIPEFAKGKVCKRCQQINGPKKKKK